MSAGVASTWRLFRYHHADGTAKDWAYRRLADGDLEICWGRTGQVRQQRQYAARDGTLVLRRAAEKQGKGYVALGEAELKEGALVLIHPSAPATGPIPAAAAPRSSRTASRLVPGALDLSQIAAGEDDFWF
ncbi:hypothetical protein CKO42_20105 [Lamprobacter modestohalophilus]|uniref:Uncharacterized protein n=1 Tax=Lamprobacter modestohalophilus TaxID=1064514 RepID=A0A9X0WC26_9GAMM|nr:hypothetical protein [Lamprobacter modestohalophilus]MBK1620691.1 hypothetical protein [Lamprobacter modestohalophilus]